MDAADLFETHIKPYLLNSFADADAIMLAGSQGRMLSGQTTGLAKKSSDYDFILYFEKLPARYPAAMFASQWLTVPGQSEPISIDLKIIDRAYLEYHTQHTREVRRFPFLFCMMMDAFPLKDDIGITETMRRMAAAFVKAGPAPIGPRQIAETQNKINALETAMLHSATPRDNAVMAIESLSVLASALLLSSQDWVSPIGRNLVALREGQPGQEKRLMKAFNDANGGDYVVYRDILRDITQLLDARRSEGNADSVLLNPDPRGLVAQAEVSDSSNKGDKIMLGQYLARMKDADDLDPLRLVEMKSLLWTTAKSYLCRKFDVPFAYGAQVADQLDQLMGKPVLAKLLQAIQKEDVAAMYTSINAVLKDQKGVSFSYLERIYIEDLARRREATSATNDNTRKGGNNSMPNRRI